MIPLGTFRSSNAALSCARVRVSPANTRAFLRFSGSSARWVNRKDVDMSGPKQGAIQSDAALRQSIEPRQMAAATLSDGALLAIL
jgi:hypothetical protein